MSDVDRLTSTVCGRCKQIIDVVEWFKIRDTDSKVLVPTTHALYPDGKVQWCYVDGFGVVCGLTPDEYDRVNNWQPDKPVRTEITLPPQPVSKDYPPMGDFNAALAAWERVCTAIAKRGQS